MWGDQTPCGETMDHGRKLWTMSGELGQCGETVEHVGGPWTVGRPSSTLVDYIGPCEETMDIAEDCGPSDTTV